MIQLKKAHGMWVVRVPSTAPKWLNEKGYIEITFATWEAAKAALPVIIYQACEQ